MKMMPPQWLNEPSRDLSRYGLLSLNLARPEYIMAGPLWAFLSRRQYIRHRDKSSIATPHRPEILKAISTLALLGFAA